MFNLNIKIEWFIILALVAVIVIQRSCAPGCECDPNVIIEDEIVIEGDKDPTTVLLPFPEPYEVIRPDTITPLIDTLAILAEYEALMWDYHSRYNYKDTLKNDSSALVILEAHTLRNRLSYDKMTFLNRRATRIIHNQTITNPRNKLFVGLGVGRSPQEFGISGSLMFQNKKDHAYSLSYDLINKDLYFTMYWKIRLKRK